MTQYETRYCTHCGTALAWITQLEDGGDKARLRCPACGWTHWNNPTPVLAAIVEVNGQVLLARNAAWQEKMYALITGFMEAGESPQEGIAREVKEETNLDVQSAKLVGAYEFLRMNFSISCSVETMVFSSVSFSRNSAMATSWVRICSCNCAICACISAMAGPLDVVMRKISFRWARDIVPGLSARLAHPLSNR